MLCFLGRRLLREHSTALSPTADFGLQPKRQSRSETHGSARGRREHGRASLRPRPARDRSAATAPRLPVRALPPRLSLVHLVGRGGQTGRPQPVMLHAEGGAQRGAIPLAHPPLHAPSCCVYDGRRRREPLTPGPPSGQERHTGQRAGKRGRGASVQENGHEGRHSPSPPRQRDGARSLRSSGPTPSPSPPQPRASRGQPFDPCPQCSL